MQWDWTSLEPPLLDNKGATWSLEVRDQDWTTVTLSLLAPVSNSPHTHSWLTYNKFKIPKLPKNLVFATSHLFFAFGICICIWLPVSVNWLPALHRINFKLATITFKVLPISSSHPISPPLFHDMCRRDHYGLLLCQCVPTRKTCAMANSKSLSSCHLLPRIFGTNCHIIFPPIPLFLLSGRD